MNWDWFDLSFLGTRLHKIFSFEQMDSMVFNRLDFWLFFIFIMMIYPMLHHRQLLRSFFITVVSVFLYYKTSGLFCLLLLFSICVNYGIGRWIYGVESTAGRKWIIALSAVFNVFFLAFFKYANFFTESYNELFHTSHEAFNWFAQWGNSIAGHYTFETAILLPAGVSFFTFQSISYTVDIYRKEIEPVRNFFDYAFYLTYFPHVIMGPIVRARDFIPQIYQPFQLNKQQFSESVVLIVKGLVKKIVLADFIAVHFIDKVVDTPEAYPGFVSILAMWGYSLQIYGDFSGYTDIAIGLSRLMGFELLPNFNSPYKANSVADFWRRWHKSLGAWLRDYLYIPLGGNKKGTIGTYVAIAVIFTFLIFITGWYDLIFIYAGLIALYAIVILVWPRFQQYMNRDLNLLITMIVGGLWHGPTEYFVIWGAMNGIALVVYNHWKKVSPYENSRWWIVHFWKIFLTFNFITFTRIWFRLQGKDDGAVPMDMLNQIWYHFGIESWADLQKLWNVIWSFGEVFTVIAIGYFVHWMPQRWKDACVAGFTRMPVPVQMVSVSISVLLMYQAVSGPFKPFVYFEF